MVELARWAASFGAMHSFANTRSEAVFSACSLYRFWLCREWGVAAPFGLFLLHNPSTADALLMDPTTLVCHNLALQWGWRGFGIVNLNPFIATDIDKVLSPSEMADSDNDRWIRKACSAADVIVLASGEDGYALTLRKLQEQQIRGPFHAIDRLKGGGFKHPMYSDLKKYPAPQPVELRV